MPGAAEDILRTLAELGFEWDESVVHQSARTEAYAAALAKLDAAAVTFRCSCSRQELAAGSRPGGPAETDELFYPGTCRDGPRHRNRPQAVRFRVPAHEVAFRDGLQGDYAEDVSRSIGDFVVRRRDGLFAYQLAVVVDDADQRITEVVRGSDLLSNTPRQILLQQALDLPTPGYAHLPLLVESGGEKLAKARHSVPVQTRTPALVMHAVLKLLRQSPPPELATAPIGELWAWAIRHWNPVVLQGLRQIELDPI